MLIQCHRFPSSKLEEIDEDSKPREDGIWIDLDPYNLEAAKLGKTYVDRMEDTNRKVRLQSEVCTQISEKLNGRIYLLSKS